MLISLFLRSGLISSNFLIYLYKWLIFAHLYIYNKSYHKMLCSSISFFHWTLLYNWKYFSMILLISFMSTMTFYVISEPQFKRKRRKKKKRRLTFTFHVSTFFKVGQQFCAFQTLCQRNNQNEDSVNSNLRHAQTSRNPKWGLRQLLGLYICQPKQEIPHSLY